MPEPRTVPEPGAVPRPRTAPEPRATPRSRAVPQPRAVPEPRAGDTVRTAAAPAWSLPRQRRGDLGEAPVREPLLDRYRQAAASLDAEHHCERCDRRDRRVKRAVDIAGSLACLVAGSPILLLAAAAVRAEDGGPALFRQERIGEHGRPFTIFKYRTMVPDAENRGAGMVTFRGDPRITRVGRLLRATSVDELPQLLNVLRGEMSLVGPRPTVRSQVERYTPRQLRRLSVPPGIAGWAQVNGRNSIPWSRRIELDIWYVEHRSLRLDLAIILRAARIILAGGGTYGAGGMNQDLDVRPQESPAQAVPGPGGQRRGGVGEGADQSREVTPPARQRQS